MVQKPGASTTALLGAGAWLLGAESFVRPGSHQSRDALFLVPWALYAAVITGIHLVQRSHASRVERWAYRFLMLAIASGAVANVALVLGADGLANAAFRLGAGGFLVGMAAFGPATARAGVLPTRVGRLLAVAQPLTMLTGVALSPIAGCTRRGATRAACSTASCSSSSPRRSGSSVPSRRAVARRWRGAGTTRRWHATALCPTARKRLSSTHTTRKGEPK